MIKADDIFASLAPFPLDTDQFLGVNVVAIVWRVIARISTARDRGNDALLAIKAAE